MFLFILITFLIHQRKNTRVKKNFLDPNSTSLSSKKEKNINSNRDKLKM